MVYSPLDLGPLQDKVGGDEIVQAGITGATTAGSSAGAEGASEAGVSAGVSAGTAAGTTAGISGGVSGGLVVMGGLEAGASAWLGDLTLGGSASSALQSCGGLSCDPHARCVGTDDGPTCECEPRYEGDGEVCEPQACPDQASGAPQCLCDEGYEGELTYDLASRSWLGRCLRVDRECDDGVSSSTSCGVGQCRAEGTVSCEEGRWVTRCEPLPPSPSGDFCDGFDDDCDGEVDEDFQPSITQCGVGVCAVEGELSCVRGREVNSCTPPQPRSADADCNGLDDDCDSVIDEGFVSEEVSCGVGVCVARGYTACEAGEVLPICSPRPPLSSDDDCDGVDEDCDGSADEAYVGVPVTCGVGACLFDGFTSCLNGVAQELCTPLPAAASDEVCDGVDEDCDGRVDEDVTPELTRCGLGVCSSVGELSCVEGEPLNSCTPTLPIGEDVSCDAIDDDCDGQLDEAYVSTQVACEGAGEHACPVSAPTRCEVGEVRYDCEIALEGLSDASCDGVDDDCDGSLDEDYVSVEVRCGEGVCADSSMSFCREGVVMSRCQERTPSGDDSDCDGRDDDCDGATDEGFVEGPISCGYGECVSQGVARCVAGELERDCAPLAPVNADESSCNGLDDDCDGRVDEAFVSTTSFCGDGVCASRGSSSCSAGNLSLNCVPLEPTGPDNQCDGLDNDCDATTDEDYPPVTDFCGVGACYTSASSSCVGGLVQNNCVPLDPIGDDSTCDGIDDDCDGAIDEAYVPTPAICIFGQVCAEQGLKQCINGQRVNVCAPPAFFTGVDNSCDNQDNDCDGSTDEGYLGGDYFCGAGVCRRTGQRFCTDGVESGGNCVPGNPTGGDNDCDNVDEDCDGRSDESYGTQPASCGTGVCRRSGTQTCSGGGFIKQCSPGSPTGIDDDNDNQDNDCDGRVDEDYDPPPPPAETNCDGLDNDLDGSVDEGYVSTPTTCTSGACSGTGALVCQNGSVVDTCVVAAGGADNTCDGVDNDCDGSTDEGYVGSREPCGVGACKSSGFYLCQGGVVTHDCTPGQPGTPVAGNNIDEDCDGSIDEGGGGTGGNPCGPFPGTISRGYTTLEQACTGSRVQLTEGVLMTEPISTSVLNTVVCIAATNQPITWSGGNLYYAHMVINTNEFDYWRIDANGIVRENGTYTCGDPNGGER